LRKAAGEGCFNYLTIKKENVMLISRLVILFFCLLSSLCYANNQTVYFEPKETTLTGVVTTLTFPGAPNYESIKNGDKAENGPYLILKTPVDIDIAPNTEKMLNDAATKNVQVIQLVVSNDKDWKEIKKGNVVEITGSLSSPVTGHHHARALLDVKNVKVMSKENVKNKQLSVSDEDKDLLKNQKD